MRRFHRLSTTMMVPVLLATGCYSDSAGDTAAKFAGAGTCVAADDVDAKAARVLQLVNLERTAADANLQPVRFNARLSAVADAYACRMIEDGFFDHTDPITGRGPGDRAIAGRYFFYAVGENLAAGPTSAAHAMQVWMDSSGHRSIILDPQWTDVGIGVRYNSEDGMLYWVQMFGLPASR